MAARTRSWLSGVSLNQLELTDVDEKAVIDRIEEGEHAVLLVGEDEREWVIPVGRLPSGAVAGTWLRVRIEGEELVDLSVDAEETEQVRQRIADKMARLRQRGRRLKPSE